MPRRTLPAPSMRSIRAVTFTFAALGSVGLCAVIENAPAFQSSLQVPGVDGDTILPMTAEMYRPSAYYFQQGVSLLRADVWTIFQGVGIGSGQEAQAQFVRASQLLEESLRTAPGHGWTWAHYAQTLTSVGRFDEARAALRNARALAPNQSQQTVDRIVAWAAIRDALEITPGQPELTQEELAGYQADRQVVAFHFGEEVLQAFDDAGF